MWGESEEVLEPFFGGNEPWGGYVVDGDITLLGFFRKVIKQESYSLLKI